MKFKWPFVRRALYDLEREMYQSALRRGDKLLQTNSELWRDNNQLRDQIKTAQAAHQQSIDLFKRHLTRLAQVGNNSLVLNTHPEKFK